jgi:hypothetical protein
MACLRIQVMKVTSTAKTEAPRRTPMPLWQRLLITLAVMLLASYLVGLLWQWIFTAEIPSYLSGAVGGISAVPTWEFLLRIRRKQ